VTTGPDPNGRGIVRCLAPEAKIAALVGYVLLVVATPTALWPVLVIDAVLLAIVVLVARIPAHWLVPRLVLETPVVLFALLLPLVATGPRVEVLGLTLSRPGLEGAALLLTRTTLGLVAALTLVATTPADEVVDGLGRLRMPRPMVEILTFMVRYLGLVRDDLRRMEVARAARGDRRAGWRRWLAGAASVGHLFVRSYERGERVEQAMLARGYRGSLPQYATAVTGRPRSLLAALLPALAATALAGGLVLR